MSIDSTPRHHFKRTERLKRRKVIERLFAEGNSFGVYPLRLVWVELDPPLSPAPVQMGLSVSKRKFNKAAHRNVLRRRIREAWRQNKYWLYERLPPGQQFAFMILYVAKESYEYPGIERALRKMSRRFLHELKDRETSVLKQS